jgi:anionic cell wall polymer biosynthesis LytR-Cps2A-Psr (LCP) family protein
LNGKQALDYARMRKSDPKGDYGRQARQRQIILAIVNEALSIKSLNNYRAILKAFSQNVKTNMSFDDMMGLATNYRSCASNISSDYIHGHDAWIGGAAMQVAQTKELQRISDRVRAGLGLTKETLHNQETRQNRLNRKHHLKWSDPTAFENYVVYSRHSHRPWYGN